MTVETYTARRWDANSFDLPIYLAERDQRQSFTMVELGHRDRPIARRQENLTHNRAYIGIEAWTRDRMHEHYVHDLVSIPELRNSFFLQQYLYPDMDHSESRDSHYQSKYRQPYNPTTILPDGAADELFLGNVFGDPHIHAETGRTDLLLEECHRLVGATGMLVIRETITPLDARLDDDTLQIAGFEAVHREYFGNNPKAWDQLEDRFNGGRERFKPHPHLPEQTAAHYLLAQTVI